MRSRKIIELEERKVPFAQGTLQLELLLDIREIMVEIRDLLDTKGVIQRK